MSSCRLVGHGGSRRRSARSPGVDSTRSHRGQVPNRMPASRPAAGCLGAAARPILAANRRLKVDEWLTALRRLPLTGSWAGTARVAMATPGDKAARRVGRPSETDPGDSARKSTITPPSRRARR